MLDDEEQSQKEFQKALEKDSIRFEQLQQKWDEPYVLFSMAKTYFEMKNYAAAVEYAQKAYTASAEAEERTTIKEWMEKVEKVQN